MTSLTIQIPDSIRRHVERLAAKDGISVDQFLSTAAAEKLAALETVDYIARRASRADNEAFEAVMRKIPNREPAEEWDKTP